MVENLNRKVREEGRPDLVNYGAPHMDTSRDTKDHIERKLTVPAARVRLHAMEILYQPDSKLYSAACWYVRRELKLHEEEKDANETRRREARESGATQSSPEQPGANQRREQPGTDRRNPGQPIAVEGTPKHTRTAQRSPKDAQSSLEQPKAAPSNPEQPKAAQSSRSQPRAAKRPPRQPEHPRAAQRKPERAKVRRHVFQ